MQFFSLFCNNRVAKIKKKKREKIILLLDFDAKKVQLTTKIEKEVTRLFTTRKDITHTVAFFFLNYTNVDL